MNGIINGTFRTQDLAAEVIAKRANDMLTLRQLEELTGVKKAVINTLEAGKIEMPTLSTVIALCNYVGKEVQFFITPVTKKNKKGGANVRNKG
jgi:transcriptional regulator with XRE-family HTH domain